MLRKLSAENLEQSYGNWLEKVPTRKSLTQMTGETSPVFLRCFTYMSKVTELSICRKSKYKADVYTWKLYLREYKKKERNKDSIASANNLTHQQKSAESDATALSHRDDKPVSHLTCGHHEPNKPNNNRNKSIHELSTDNRAKRGRSIDAVGDTTEIRNQK